LWASGYEIYDRLSQATAVYLKGLTAIHDASFFNGVAERLGYPIRENFRGSELNLGKNCKPHIQSFGQTIRFYPLLVSSKTLRSTG
jgi:hypothetical protein